MRTLHSRLLVAVLAVAAGMAAAAVHAAEGGTVKVTVVNVAYEGTKLWLPGTIAARKGDRITIKLINDVPGEPAQHGFAIPAYDVAVIVDRGAPKTVEFVADRAGIFPITCHLHPAHVAGQLVILD
jgi:nitrosocyanin